MTVVSVNNLTKAFEDGNNILDGLSFEIAEGEHIGILGKNGAGKTTLFRLLTGDLEPDAGEIALAPGRRLGLISQIPIYPADFTAEDVLKSAHDRLYQIKSRMEELEKAMTDRVPEGTLQEYDRLAYDFQRLGGYEMESERNRVANGLSIPESQRAQLFSTLSGGEKTRVNLARLILEDTDILLLDEPTNHLDLRATEWLEDFIAKYHGTVLAVSHDRYFLDRIVTRTIEITGGKAEFYGGNYSFYIEEKERRYLEQLKRYEREQAEAKRLSESAERLYQWGTGNSALMKKSFAIRKRIDRLVQTERPDQEKKIKGGFSAKAFRGDEVLLMRGVSKGFNGRELFRDVGLEVQGGERIALIGDNGAGKSTLIKLILGEESPDSGLIRLGPAVKSAYLPQIIKFRNPCLSLLDTVVLEEKCSPQTARNMLGAFLFSGEDVFRQVDELSGGEKSRLRMCMLMSGEVNFLILDEPTNHLDAASRDWMEKAVSDFDETLLFVSHDRYFINHFATRIWELENGAITDFKGTFEQFRIAKAAKSNEVSRKKAEIRGEKHANKSGRSPSRRLAKLEHDIAEIEDRLKAIAGERDTFSTDYEKLMGLDDEEKELRSKLEPKYEEWTELAELAEQQ